MMDIFYRRVRIPPSFAGCSKDGARCAGVTARFSIPVWGWGLCGWLLCLPPDSPGSQGRGDGAEEPMPGCVTVTGAWCLWGAMGKHGGKWDFGAPRLRLQVVFKSLLGAWLTGTIHKPIKSN